MKALNLDCTRSRILSLSLWLAGCLTLMVVPAHASYIDSAKRKPTPEQPKEIVQAFLDTMDYQLLSADDRAVWSEDNWQEIQHDAAQANQVRLPVEHEFHGLEQKVRSHVSVNVIGSEIAEDGSARVVTEFEYPYILMLIDDYIDTRSSYIYEQLQDYNRAFKNDTLALNGQDVFRSTMPWRVKNGGVFVNAAQLQENRETLQARGGI